GAATLAGLNWAIDQNYDFAINMDADFSHPPRFLPQLIGVMNRCDVGIGSRYVPHGGIEGWGINRHLMSRAINLYSQMLLGLKVRDCSGAFRCYRISKLREIDFSKFRARGYAFQEEMLYRCIRIGSRTTEIPIIFENRQTGVSKINVREMYCAVRDIFLLGIDSIRDAPVGFLS
ncbi:MAG: glycosyltransferase, partial [Planctomycetes bacterium]|nr:glycosyltransferase [Planctomycetota bacterium]